MSDATTPDSPHDKAPIIGIDLGTTFSLVSVLQNGQPLILPNVVGELLTPSAVSIDESGHVLVGAAARARATTHPEQTALAFKRDMGTDRTYMLGKQSFRAEQLSALVLAELKRDAEHALGRAIEEAVITVPAYFGEAQRHATRVAGELAGLRVERIINEPTAAAMAYGLHARDRELRAIVLDLGGGTFDVTVLEIIEGVIEVQASAGDARLGGEDFVDALFEDAVRRIEQEHGVRIASDRVLAARLREACEVGKRALSSSEQTSLVLASVRTASGVIDIALPLTRAQAEQLWEPLLARIRQPIARALRDANKSPSDFQEVLLVGGATRMPCFVELAARTFGRMPSRSLPPDEAVALGAAVQAALKKGDRSVEDLVVTDVAPFSLGIAVATKHGSRHVQGMFSSIIDRGTVIPVSRSERFQTLGDNQTQIEIEVYQGEHSLCRDNQKLGAFVLDGLPRKPAGSVSIEVRFTYDLNGLLEVEATVPDTDNKRSLLIEKRPGALSAKQIEEARSAMKKLKFHPRDALPNRTALARADAVFAELTGDARDQLGAGIAYLRGALDSQDPAEINEARERLNALTDALRRR